MAIDNPVLTLKYKIDSSFAANFDELQNIDISNRKSDVGFTEQDKLMIKMRPGTVQVGNTIAGGAGTSKQFFYTDFAKVRRHYRGYNSKLWYNNAGTWTDIGTFSSNDFEFNVVKIPVMVSGSPSSYTTPSVSAGNERVKISLSDPNYGIVGGSVIGKVIMITSDPVYKGVFGTIIKSDGVDYTLLGSGMIEALGAGATYQIYDTTGEYLQVMDGVSDDRYFQGVTENTAFKGLAIASLRLIKGIRSDQYIKKQVSFNFSMWSFSKTTLYHSSGEINNPFFHTIDSAYSLPFSGDIVDIFVFKNRLIVGGTNFLISIYPDLHYSVISSSFGIKYGSLVDLGQDMYFLSTNGFIKSLSENISGTIISTDIGMSVSNYTKNFLTNIISGFDGRKMYMYGQVNSSTEGKIVVFDLVYKFWSTYTGLRPSSIVQEDGVVYITSNNSDKVLKFDPSVITDSTVQIAQRVVTKEIDLGDVFGIKELKMVLLWLENISQSVFMNIFASMASKNSLVYKKLIKVTEKVIPAYPSPSLGHGVLGENPLGGSGITSDISYPFMIKEVFPVDKANIWKLEIVGKDGSPFYLNEMDVKLKWSGEKGTYFSPSHTF